MFESEYEILRRAGIVPVVSLENNGDALPVVEAMLRGGIRAVEIMFRNPADYEGTARAIRFLREKFPDISVGAGTVINRALAEMAIDAGANFVVSPGLSEAVVDVCISRGIAAYPGVATPSEITAALDKGLRVLKLFPSELLGGAAALKAFAGPFPQAQFFPSGGVNAENAGSYLSHSNVAAISGSWIAQKNLIKEKRWDEITRLSAEAVALFRAFRPDVQINN